jgi:beta-lactamase regulating signal transducer with metallopeptidase domain
MINWLIITSLTGSLVVLFILLFKKILVKRLGGYGYYLVCVITLVLFVLPVRIPISADVNFNVTDSMPVTQATNEGGNVGQIAFNTAAAVHTPSPEEMEAPTRFSRMLSELTVVNGILIVWSCGFLFMLSRYLVNYFRFKHKVVGQLPIGKVDRLDIVISEHVHSPMLVGFFRPTIVIPDKAVDEEDYKLAILHELNHYKQGDAWIKLFAVVIHSLHWFNPLTYAAIANLSEACEYSCDEKITKHMQLSEKKKYSEMILAFASQPTPILSSSLFKSKKQLYRRFEMIMGSHATNKKYVGVLLVCVMVVLSIVSTSLVFAEEPKTVTENSGATKTYYNTSNTLEENVKSTFNIPNPSQLLMARVTDAPFYIDQDGLKVDVFNRTEPYYMIQREWQQKDTALEQKSVSVEGKTVTVAFTEKTAAYKDDEVIEKMIRNQISFELQYQDKQNRYDHSAFINELIQQGMIVVMGVTEPKDFKFQMWTKENGDQLGRKALTSYDKKDKITNVFNQKILLNQNIDGNQGKQVGSTFTIKSGETLMMDIKKVTDKMPTVNLAIVNVTTGEIVEVMPNITEGSRYIYIPNPLFENHTFKIVMSAEASDSADIEIFTTIAL